MAVKEDGRGRRVFATAAVLVLIPLLFCRCTEEEEPEGQAPPPGVIRELESEKSITTDVNARAPAFARENSQGEVIRTQDFIGRKVLLLDFWSVFCQSCLMEMPFLQDLHERYKGEGLEIVSVNTDFFPQARIESFMKKTGLTLPFPLVLDRDQSLSELFQVEALPVTVLIDSAGWIRMVHLGYRPKDEEMIESRVRKACRKIRETVVTLQPVDGRTAFVPPSLGRPLLEPGSAVPDFRSSTEGGDIVSFSSLRSDSPAVVFFWSLFCQPCREEFPHLLSLAKKYSSRGLWMAAVNVDAEKLRPAAARFTSGKGGDTAFLFDSSPDGEGTGAAEVFGVHHTPSTFLLDSGGKVFASFIGEVSAEALEEKVLQLLAAPTVGASGKKREAAP
jgi:peroxiredoxin